MFHVTTHSGLTMKRTNNDEHLHYSAAVGDPGQTGDPHLQGVHLDILDAVVWTLNHCFDLTPDQMVPFIFLDGKNHPSPWVRVLIVCLPATSADVQNRMLALLRRAFH